MVYYFRQCGLFEVWEMLWIFKVARCTCDRCPKINKSPTVSNGIGASSFEIWTANLAQLLTVGTLTNSQSFIFGDSNWKFCKVGYPVGPQKTDIQMWTFLTWNFCFFYFLVKNKAKPIGYTRTMYLQTGKTTKWAETFLSGVYYWFLKLYTRIIWHSYFPSHEIL